MGLHSATRAPRHFARPLAALSILLIAGTAAGQSKPSAPVALQGKQRTAFLKKVEQRMSKVQTVVAAFAQTKHLSLFDDDVVTHGHILYARPDLLRWEIQAPFQSILIVAKAQVAKFEFHQGKRRQLKLGRSADIILMVMDQIRSWFRGDFTRSTKNYQVQIFTPKNAAARIELRPRSKAMRQNLQLIELRLNPSFDGIDRVTIREKGGDSTVMQFTPLQKNPKLPARLFAAKDPSPFDAKQFQVKPKPTPPTEQRPGKSTPAGR